MRNCKTKIIATAIENLELKFVTKLEDVSVKNQVVVDGMSSMMGC